MLKFIRLLELIIEWIFRTFQDASSWHEHEFFYSVFFSDVTWTRVSVTTTSASSCFPSWCAAPCWWPHRYSSDTSAQSRWAGNSFGSEVRERELVSSWAHMAAKMCLPLNVFPTLQTEIPLGTRVQPGATKVWLNTPYVTTTFIPMLGLSPILTPMSKSWNLIRSS